MFNSILRYFLTQFFKISLATCFNIRLVFLASISTLSLMLALPTVLILIGFTIFSYVFMQKNQYRLHEENFQGSYGSLYAKVEIYNHKEALKYTFYFCVRRMVTALIIASFQGSTVLQVFLLVQVSLIMTLWAIKTKPMIDTASNIVFITNELVVLICSYLILLFTDFVVSFEERYKLGFVYIWIFLF